MKRYVDEAREILGKGASDSAAGVIAFWMVASRYIDLLPVKIADEETSLQLKRGAGKNPRPYAYESAPLDKRTAEALAGMELPEGVAYILRMAESAAIMVWLNTQFYKEFKVPIEQVKILD